ncbi:hypothetical protein HOD38_03980 [archaeon]|jgi:hypothetical protein|nr:hypothetical protein [archaeon]MBT4397401.1 hypothetical protein [archaeon]MBT4440473.1 hypothetical protein [archaeon]
MEKGLFNWAIITALVSALLFFVVGLFTSDDLIVLALVVILSLISIIVFSKKAEGSFTSGAFLAMVVFAVMTIVVDLRNWEGLGVALFIFTIVFLVGGFIGKWSSKDKEKLSNKIYFWVMIGAGILGVVMIVVGILTNVSYLAEPIAFTCESDESCGEGYTCVESVCLFSGVTTTVYDFEGGIGSWYGDTECTAEVGGDPCWHIEYEEDGNAVIEGWEHIWLFSTIQFSRIDSVEAKVMMRDGGFHLNFIDAEESRYFLSIENDGLLLHSQLGEEFDDYQSADYEFENDKWYDLRIEVGDTVTVYVNDEMVLSDILNQEYDKAIVTLETLEDSSVWLDDIVVEGELYITETEIDFS